MGKALRENIIYLAFLQAIVAMAGSLFFSEILHFPPCVLCWYQRICMYPLVALLAVGIYFKDKHIYRYVLPLSIIGLLISIFHNLLYYKILPEAAAPCQLGVSCTTKFIQWFGFITIPFLSFVAFAVITAIMVWLLRQQRQPASSSKRGGKK